MFNVSLLNHHISTDTSGVLIVVDNLIERENIMKKNYEESAFLYYASTMCTIVKLSCD